MDLSNYNFPKITQVDLAFPTFDAPVELVEEAKNRHLEKGRAKFNELFYKGGQLKLKSNIKGTWREDALLFAKALMGSFKPKHEDKEAVCALIFEECLIL